MKLTTFQLIVLILFGFFILVGIGVFALYGGGFRNAGTGKVVIWGTVDGQLMDPLLTALSQQNKAFEGVEYVQKNPSSYSASLVNAMAAGNGPDLFLVTQDSISGFADKISVIPYSAFSQSMYNSSFIDEAQLFLTPQGTDAIPFTIDPLVMYWNRDLFATAGIAQPPRHWDDFLSLTPKITSIDTTANVSRSAVALGEWQNITYAKMILSALIMQAGDPIVVRAQSGSLQTVFGNTPQGTVSNPASSALLFYTEFANPSKTTYSWNRALPQSQAAFAAGNLAVYFGLASDYGLLQQTNPNLNFAVEELPQIQGNTIQLTYGELTGFAIPRTTSNPQGALVVAEALSSLNMQQLMLKQTGLLPVRRDISIDTSASATTNIFIRSILIARGWLDPDQGSTNSIFQDMIESILSGKQNPAGAVQDAKQALSQLVGA